MDIVEKPKFNKKEYNKAYLEANKEKYNTMSKERNRERYYTDTKLVSRLQETQQTHAKSQCLCEYTSLHAESFFFFDEQDKLFQRSHGQLY